MLKTFERCGLLDFVSPNFLPIKVLLVESEEFLSGLRKLLPAAQIALLKEEPSRKIEMLCDEFKVDLIYELPTMPKTFEIVIAKDVLTVGKNFFAMLMLFNQLLTDSGYLLTQFYNVRFIAILERLKQGRFFDNKQRLWAKADVVKLLDETIYKEVQFLPGERENISVDAWKEFGFDNFNEDLTTKFWLVQACKCTAEVAALKDVFTPEVRAELARLLHRIEYDIDAEENFQLLMKLCDREGIFDEYLSDFINQVVFHDAAKDFIRQRAKNFGRLLN